MCGWSGAGAWLHTDGRDVAPTKHNLRTAELDDVAIGQCSRRRDAYISDKRVIRAVQVFNRRDGARDQYSGMTTRHSRLIDRHGAAERISPDDVLALVQDEAPAVPVEHEYAADACGVPPGVLHFGRIGDECVAFPMKRSYEPRLLGIV